MKRKLISTDSQTYYILSFFADSVFYFLPILLAFSEAKKLKCNPILAASVAGIMMHPNWSSLVTAGAEVKFFEIIPFTLASYTSTVIPIILVILVQSYVERKLEKWIPQSVKLVFIPMLTFIIMGTLALSVLGPIGTIFGGYLATFFNFLSVNASWAPAFIIGAFLPLMVMFGLHNGVAPLGVMQMADLGYDSIFGPGCFCSNMAQATASLVVSFRTKDKKIKQLATSGSITAFMGITEPTLYSHGTVIMIDPLLEGFDLPLLVDMPIKSEEVPNLDAVLITHCDNDHFSRTTCKNLSNVCNSYHGPHYVAELMKKEGLNGIGHDIYESFKVGNLNVKLTPADHAWQIL